MAADNSSAELPVIDEKNDDGFEPGVSLVTPSNQGEPIVTRRELWSYYLYVSGGIGLSLLSSFRIFQTLATEAGYDPVRGPGSSCLDSRGSGECVLPWGSGTKPVSSVILIANGMGFAIVTVVLTVVGPAADYGSFGNWPLLVTSLILWASMFSTMTLTSPSRWGVAMGLFTVGFASFTLTNAFYSAIFPRLACNTRHIRELKERYKEGEITADEYEQAEALEKSKLSSVSIACCMLGSVIILLLDFSILIPFQGKANVDRYIVLLPTTIAVMAGIWWFIFKQPRPGPKLPEGEHYLTIGWKQIWTALKQYKKLPNTFVYLFAYFLLADGINTNLTLVQICQTAQFKFSFLHLSYLDLIQQGSGGIGIVLFWLMQRYWKIKSKNMFMATCVTATVLPLWGMIGIWQDKFGYHSSWEFWLYNVIFGLFQIPYFAFSQTVMADLCPPGYEFMFFALFGFTNRASSIVGPNVIQAIINRTGNTWHGFPFLFAMCFGSGLAIWFAVDVSKGRKDAERWAAEQRGTMYGVHPDGKEKLSGGTLVAAEASL